MDARVYLPQEWRQGAPKIAMFEILLCTETRKSIHLRAQPRQKYESGCSQNTPTNFLEYAEIGVLIQI